EENLDKAERELKKERFDEARGYAKKALEIDPESSAAIEALKNINAEEKAYIAAETARKEGEARIKKEAEAEAARRAEEERQGKIEKEIEDNLDKAEKELKNGDFVKADEYAKKALNLDAKSRRAANMIASVKRAEIAYQSEQKRLELTQKASKEKEEKKRLSREKRQGAQQIANEKVKMYLRQAEEALSKKRFGAARGYVDKAFKNDGESPEIGEMLARIDREEVQHLDEFERERQDKENARREEKEKIKKSVENALRSANEALNKKDFAKAKEYAEKADAVSGGSDKTADMLRRIKDEQDIFEEAQRAKEMADIEAKRTQETERRKKEKERKKGERAEKVKGLLKSASVRLNKNDFEGARKTAEEALEIDEENRDVREMLDEITRREAEYESEQKRIRMEEEKRVINEQEDRKRDLRVSENLTNARDRMENRKFAKARAFVRDALKEDENNKDAAALMEKIDKEEAKYEKEQEFLKKQENDRVVRERKKAERDKKISSYLERAESELSRGRTERAMSYIERVLDLDKNNESAEKMIVRIKAMTTENEN
ncbi:MAG: hypothetical protein KKG84_04680, partial [Candidatus Omnitrophica bacterium]|nr:hypothetical protein [Candidatus Omnitrophota bacterium]